jgi:hypothetical protein
MLSPSRLTDELSALSNLRRVESIPLNPECFEIWPMPMIAHPESTRPGSRRVVEVS